ncbi:MAG: YfhO family protein [Bacteroidota bacterium]
MKKGKPSKQKSESQLIPPKFQHAASIAVIFFSLIIFFHDVVFEGKVFGAADTIASKSFETLIDDAMQADEAPLWNPYIFCGMPGVGSMMVHGSRMYDVSAYLLGWAQNFFAFIVNNKDIGWQLMYYFILGCGFYWFVYDKLQNKIAALISALAVTHTTYIIILVMVGHMTKVPVVAFFPFIFLILERLREKFSLILSLLLTLLVHFMFLPGHIQMIFYCYLAFGLYYLFFFIRAIIKKERWQGIIRSGLVFAAASILAFAMTGDQYLSTLEYSKYSTRGADSIIPSPKQQEIGNSNGGLDYEYATNWSFSPGEMLTFFIPSSHGFGWFNYQGALSQNQEMRLNTYFGNMPFTDAPQYMGVVIVILGGIGFWRNRKDPFVQYAGLVIFLSLIISFGKEFPLLYDLMFNYFPMFNKFRIPSMILILVQLLMPVLAGYGIATLMNDAEESNVKRNVQFRYALFGVGGLLILSLIAKNIFISFYDMIFSQQEIIQNLSRSYQPNPTVMNELYRVITDMVSTDITFGLMFTLISLGALYLYHQKKLSITVLTGVLVVIVLSDLWRVNYKPMDTKPHREVQSTFSTPEYVHFLKQDTTMFRTLEFENGQPPYNNTLAYWKIQSAYGYSGTKMRQVQDMFDVIGLGNPLMWGLMNVKYILSDRPDSNNILLPVYSGSGKNVLFNRAALPRTFFVNRYAVATGIEILQNIKSMSFDPRDVAYVMEDPGLKIDPPQTEAKADYKKFGMHDVELSVTATGNNLLFISETWYPEGWKAYIDGEETQIYRLNYMFRGVVVPQGEHTVTMKYSSTAYSLGKQLSMWINLLLLGGIGYIWVMYLVKLRGKKEVQK